MTTHVRDDRPAIQATTELRGGGEPSGTEKFKFWIDADPSGAEPDKVQSVDFSDDDRTYEYDYPLKPVPPDKPYYEIRWALFAGDDEAQQSAMHHYQVWPAKGSLTVKDSEDDSEVNGFKFKVLQDASGGEVARNDTSDPGENGEYTFDLHAGADYSITPVAPWAITEWVQGTENSGSQREIKVKAEIEAEFIEPYSADLAEPILKQYVNLDSSDSGRDAKGHEIIVKVGVKGDRAKAVGERLGGPGLFVYFEVQFSGGMGDKSERNDPKTEVKAHADGTLNMVEDGKKYKGKVELKSADKTGELKVELGYAGGDACEIKIGGTETCEDAKLIFINWRKLEYEMSYANIMTNLSDNGDYKDFPATIKQYVKERLGEVYIEYDLVKSYSYTKDAVRGKDSFRGPDMARQYCFSDSQFLGESGPKKERIYFDYCLAKYFHRAADSPTRFESPQPARRMAIFLAHRAFSAKKGEQPKELKKIMTEASFTFNAPSGKYFLPNNAEDGKKSLKLDGVKWKFQYQKTVFKVWTSGNSSCKDPIPDFVAWEEDVVDRAREDDNAKVFKIKELNRSETHEIRFNN